MGKKTPRKQPKTVSYDSDDERAYEKEKVPDRQARDFYYDEVDEFHATREKILLDEGASLQPAGFSSDEEEGVLGIDSDSDVDEYNAKLGKYQNEKFQEEMASDLEENENDGLPDEKAWGSKKSKFYGADVEDERDVDFSGSETGAAELEEQEVIALQKKMAEQLDEDDFGMEIFQTAKKQVEEEKVSSKEIVTKDLSKLTKKEKLELLKKESPELLELIGDYKQKLATVKDRLQPILKLVKSGVIPPGRGADFVETQTKLYLNYCINISFYLMMKAKRLPVHNHPVISRLVQFRNLIKQLEPVEAEMEQAMNEILSKIENGEEIKASAKHKQESSQPLKRYRKTSSKSDMAKRKKLSELVSDSDESSSEDDDAPAPTGGRSRKRPKVADDRYETIDEKEALAYYDMMKAGRKRAGPGNEDESGGEGEEVEGEGEGEGQQDGEEYDGDDKRGITYQMEKNKGLTPHRKKEYRNPRVKHRMKFRKAKIRRKGQVREVRTETKRYEGEFSGIRAGIKRGIRIKS